MSAVSRYTKPRECASCPLEHIGFGYVPGSGPTTDLMFLGEAPGYDEAAMGMPFVGAAGGMHTRILRRNELSREAFRHENVLRCVPPDFEIKKGWAQAAADHCRPYRLQDTAQAKVVVALGATAIREALGLWQYDVDDVKVNNFHGTVHDSPHFPGQQVVCSFHPSFLQRGALNLLGVVSFDLQVALEVRAGTWQRDEIETVIDPPLEWVDAYIDEYEYGVRMNPGLWLATDIETPDKEKGKSEDELDETSRSFQIDRVNYAYHPDQGVTFPYEGPYIARHKRLQALAKIMVMWNGDYDLRRLLAAGHQLQSELEIYDGMWLGHHLNSNIPLGLGFWAPFYSRHGAWKHLFSLQPGYYAACDGPQELRTTRGIVADLQANRQWDVAHRHTVTYMQQVLKPAQTIGIHVDRPTLDDFEERLAGEVEFRLRRLQEIVPESLRPLTPKDGLSKMPVGEHPKARLTNTRTGAALADADDRDPLKVALYKTATVVEQQVERKVLVCHGCGAEGVQARHRCPGKDQTPSLALEPRMITRYFWQEPFNPDSPPQVLAYLAHRGHKPGRNKKSKKDTTDRDTLQRLRASTKDEFYGVLLDLRALGKVRGTYAIGVRKRLDSLSRFHPTFTLRPSTLRNSAVAPNIQNVVSDRDEDSLAAGFRACITATDDLPEWTKDWTEDQIKEYI